MLLQWHILSVSASISTDKHVSSVDCVSFTGTKNDARVVKVKNFKPIERRLIAKNFTASGSSTENMTQWREYRVKLPQFVFLVKCKLQFQLCPFKTEINSSAPKSRCAKNVYFPSGQSLCFYMCSSSLSNSAQPHEDRRKQRSGCQTCSISISERHRHVGRFSFKP